jgi:hypothetical protein
VFGRWLGRQQRTRIAEIIAEHVCQSGKIENSPTEIFHLNDFLHMTEYRSPSRLGIERVGLTSCTLAYFGSKECDHLDIEYPLPFRTSRLGLFERRGLPSPIRTLNETRKGARVVSVAFQIEVLEPTIFPSGLIIRGQISKRAVTIENDLDIARYIVMAWIDYMKLSAENAPLLVAMS